MKRYSGQDLRSDPRVVVLGSCKVGNFVVSTPVLRGIKERWPAATLDYIGSEVTTDFETGCPWIDWRCSWDLSTAAAGSDLMQTLEARCQSMGPVDLAINLDGFNPVTQLLASWIRPTYIAGGALSQNLRSHQAWGDLPQQRFLEETDWDSPEFLQRHQNWLTTNSISELFCRLAWINTDVHAIELASAAPPFAIPDVLIHCTTARAAKVWPFEHWKTTVDACNDRGISVGLVGSPPKAQREAYNSGDGEEWLLNQTKLIDLRGRTTLLELAGACRETKAVISVDAGPMHIAAAVGPATLALVGNDLDGTGASPIRLWLPRTDNLARTISPHSCDRCASNRFRNDACLVNGHPCMQTINPKQVTDWLSGVPGLRKLWNQT